MKVLTELGLPGLLTKIKTALSGKQDKITLPNDASQFYNGAGSFSKPPNTTYGRVTAQADGLAPQLNGNTGQYLNGNGQWATPPNTNTWIAFAGASASSAGTAGYVPAPGIGNQNKFFRGDGTWQEAGGGDIEEATDADISAVIALIG